MKELPTHFLIDIYLLAAVVFRLLAKAGTISAQLNRRATALD